MDKFVSIQLDRNSPEPLYVQIYEEIVRLIKEGVLLPGEKLPPIRKLAANLKVNTVTIVNAYKLLEKEGYAVSRVGSGTFIQSHLKESADLPVKNDSELEIDKIRFDFATASVPPEYFPVEIFKSSIIRVLDRDGGYAFAYNESPGFLPLRQSLEDFLYEEYKIKASRDNIHVVSGAQQGIDIISKALLDYGDTVFVESPTYPGAVDAFKSRGAKIVEITLRDDGIDMEELLSKIRSKPPKLFYTMPNFQNPTGISYSEQKKKELIALSKKFGFYILEDDHMNDLYYSEKPLPLKAYDEENRVFYIKSFSKILMPGLRLGFLLVPSDFSEIIAEVKYFSDIASSGLNQRVLDLMIREKSFYDHLTKIRRIYLEKWEIMTDSLKKHLPSPVTFSVPKGGLFYWLCLPEGFYSMNLYAGVIKKGIFIMPGDYFYPDQKPSPCFRLSIAQVPKEMINEGIEYLSHAIREFLKEFSFIPIKKSNYSPLL
ncbi:PLP-dependent aminotransferase family protein [Thermovenabulum gondwanense]|uniref:2-aminoadipate transaminase n=1 Tax=Thermovenabulum gondwanense TaxID=520767 RepID=A0A162MXW9_9FIRM|nr:PLP-dependent aminotransferase family protein [Thermovenabulum gondwanense]KYO68088.1 2-aminoadipate transaminase [Thermovenabulum gondwanense]